MRVIQHILEAITYSQVILWVWAEAIRLLAPRFHARMLAEIKEGRWVRSS